MVDKIKRPDRFTSGTWWYSLIVHFNFINIGSDKDSDGEGRDKQYPFHGGKVLMLIIKNLSCSAFLKRFYNLIFPSMESSYVFPNIAPTAVFTIDTIFPCLLSQ